MNKPKTCKNQALPYRKESRTVSFFLIAYWHDPRWKQFVGATVKIWDLAHNLVKLGHEVCLFLPKYHFDTSEPRVKIVEISFLNFPFLRSISYNLSLAFYLVFIWFKTPPDVVYVRRMGSIIPGIYARLVNALFFYEINDDPYRRDFQEEGSLLCFRIRKFISERQDEINLRLCQRAFVITKEILQKILHKNPGLKPCKLIELPSGANCDHFIPMSPKECRSHLNIDSKKCYIGFTGTLLKHQGIEVLIDAAPFILAKEPSCTFLIIGEGPMKNMWMNKVERQYLGKYFIFTGQIDYEDMPIWIGAMDICVAPFLADAGLRSPVKIFDYMACGKPVVASRIEGTTDVFHSSDAIKLVAPGDAKMLSEAITGLLANQKEAEKMGKRGREFILSNYDRSTLARKINDEVTAGLANQNIS